MSFFLLSGLILGSLQNRNYPLVFSCGWKSYAPGPGVFRLSLGASNVVRSEDPILNPGVDGQYFLKVSIMLNELGAGVENFGIVE